MSAANDTSGVPDWRTATLSDGRIVEYVWAWDAGEALDVGAGYRRLNVTVTIDGQVLTLPVVLTPEQIAEATHDGDA